MRVSGPNAMVASAFRSNAHSVLHQTRLYRFQTPARSPRYRTRRSVSQPTSLRPVRAYIAQALAGRPGKAFVAGTPTECRDRLQEYLAAGLDEMVIGISGDLEMNRLALQLVRDHNTAS